MDFIIKTFLAWMWLIWKLIGAYRFIVFKNKFIYDLIIIAEKPCNNN